MRSHAEKATPRSGKDYQPNKRTLWTCFRKAWHQAVRGVNIWSSLIFEQEIISTNEQNRKDNPRLADSEAFW